MHIMADMATSTPLGEENNGIVLCTIKVYIMCATSKHVYVHTCTYSHNLKVISLVYSGNPVESRFYCRDLSPRTPDIHPLVPRIYEVGRIPA